MTEIALQVSGLGVRDAAGIPLLGDVALTLRRGEPLVVIGETGSGKSLIAQALFGLLPPALKVAGKMIVGDREIDLSRPQQMRDLWGRQLFLIPQEPRLALDPTMRIGRQMVEGSTIPVRDAVSAIEAVDLPHEAVSYYPHMLSGGMAQRALVACAFCRNAEAIIVDEPTKGLDTLRAGRVVDILQGRVSEGRSALIITHDLDIVRRLPGQVAVIRDGRIVEQGRTASVLEAPQHAYTREWLAADPCLWRRPDDPGQTGGCVASARDVAFGYEARELLFQHLSLDIARGEIIGLMGPSGCGKTTFGNMLLGLQRPHAGAVHWGEHAIYRDRPAMRRLRQRYQKLHQDPASAFLPHRTICRQFEDLVGLIPNWQPDRLGILMERLKLRKELLHRLPHEVSGGEAQRFALARVLALRPDFIVADEPTSRLDPIVQKEVLGLLQETCRSQGIGVLLIGHHRALLEAVAHRVVDFSEFLPKS